MRGTVELLAGESSEDLPRARKLQEEAVKLELPPLVIIDSEYGSAIYGQSVLELSIVTNENVGTLVVEVDGESAELVIAAVEACKQAGASLVAVAIGNQSDIIARNILPEQIPSPMLVVHLEGEP